MKKLFRTLVPTAVATGWPLGVWAAEEVRPDGSSILIWGFLAACALIVVLQLLPAALMALGLLKGAMHESAGKTQGNPSDAKGGNR